MIELHHGEPSADTLKLLLALHELGLAFTSRYVDTARLEQWSAAHRRLAPQGQVPVLVDGGEVMEDCAFALQYLAEAYAPPASQGQGVAKRLRRWSSIASAKRAIMR